MKKFLITVVIILCIIEGVILAKMLTSKTDNNTTAQNNSKNIATSTNQSKTNDTKTNITTNSANATNAIIDSVSQTISKDAAEKIAEAKYGTKDEMTGNTISYGYVATVQDKNGNKYYAFRESWLVDNNHMSFLQNVFVSIDGQKIKTTSSTEVYTDNQVVTFDEDK